MKMLVALLVLGVAVGTGASANAKGCIKGAIVGGVAGHVAGHGAVGAAAGCVIGPRGKQTSERDSESLTAAPARCLRYKVTNRYYAKRAEHQEVRRTTSATAIRVWRPEWP